LTGQSVLQGARQSPSASVIAGQLLSLCGLGVARRQGFAHAHPDQRRLFGEYKPMTTDNLLLIRSCMYLSEKSAHVA
jgi:hypothetical protein